MWSILKAMLSDGLMAMRNHFLEGFHIVEVNNWQLVFGDSGDLLKSVDLKSYFFVIIMKELLPFVCLLDCLRSFFLLSFPFFYHHMQTNVNEICPKWADTNVTHRIGMFSSGVAIQVQVQ